MRATKFLSKMRLSADRNSTKANVIEVARCTIVMDTSPDINMALRSVISTLKGSSVASKFRHVLLIDSSEESRLTPEVTSLIRTIKSSKIKNLQVCFVGEARLPPAQAAAEKGLDALAIADEFHLRDILRDASQERDPFALGVVGPLDFLSAWAIDDMFATGFLAELGASSSRRTIPVESGTARYRLISGAGAVIDGLAAPSQHLVVPDRVSGMGVAWVNRAAFATLDLESCYFSAPMRSIGQGAFFKCRSLQRVLFSHSIEFIGRSAFASCTSLTSVRLPESLRTLGQRAFKGCSSLREAWVPASVRFIGSEAFAKCSTSLTLHVERDSYAHGWALNAGMNIDVSPAGSTPTRFFNARRFESEGTHYRVLPGNDLEVISVRDSGPDEAVVLPREVDGMPVRGLGTSALTSNVAAQQLRLPPSLRWMAPRAATSDATLVSITGLSSVSAFGESSLPLRLRREQTARSSGVLDADSIRLTLRMVCDILDLELPTHLEPYADEVFTSMSAGVLTSTPSSLFFGTFPSAQHDKIDSLRQRGVEIFVANRELQSREGQPLLCLIHPDPREAYGIVCRWIADHFAVKKIAITGSFGKTTAKEFIRRVASSAKNTLYSKGNQNGRSQIGRYLQQLTPFTEVYVQETGAAVPGLVESSAKLLRADAFVVTSIGMSHVENYGGVQANILKDKVSHDNHLQNDGVAFLNYDDEKLRALDLRHRIISYATENTEASYFASGIHAEDGIIRFNIIESATGSTTPAQIHAFGNHNVLHAVLAFAVGRWLGITVSDIVKGLNSYRSEGVRQNLVEVGGRRIFADCYNASLESVHSALDALATITPSQSGDRVFVFGDIAELGEHSESIHQQIGEAFASHSGIQKYYCFGPLSASTARIARERGVEVFHTDDRVVLHERLEQDLGHHDVVAFKASHGMALPMTIDTLFGTDFTLGDGDLVHGRSRTVTANSDLYRVFDELGAVLTRLSPTRSDTSLVVGGEVDGSPLHVLGRHSCQNTTLTSVLIEEPVRTIATSAFYLCRDLKHVGLPPSLRVIARSAFNSCISLQQLSIPEGVTTISNRAFYNCRSLKSLWIPATVQTIEAEAFKFCPNLTIACPEGSFAERFCRENLPKLPVVTSDQPLTQDNG